METLMNYEKKIKKYIYIQSSKKSTKRIEIENIK